MIDANSQIENLKTECLEIKQKLHEETETLKNTEELNRELLSRLEELQKEIDESSKKTEQLEGMDAQLSCLRSEQETIATQRDQALERLKELDGIPEKLEIATQTLKEKEHELDLLRTEQTTTVTHLTETKNALETERASALQMRQELETTEQTPML